MRGLLLDLNSAVDAVTAHGSVRGKKLRAVNLGNNKGVASIKKLHEILSTGIYT